MKIAEKIISRTITMILRIFVSFLIFLGFLMVMNPKKTVNNRSVIIRMAKYLNGRMESETRITQMKEAQKK